MSIHRRFIEIDHVGILRRARINREANATGQSLVRTNGRECGLARKHPSFSNLKFDLSADPHLVAPLLERRLRAKITSALELKPIWDHPVLGACHQPEAAPVRFGRSSLRIARISRFVSIARSQPAIGDLAWLHARGFRSVLDLRTDTDGIENLPPDREALAATACGLVYQRYPVPLTAINDDLLDRFGALLRRLPKPVLTHCTAGRRAGMFALTHVAVEQGVPGRTLLQMARDLDILYGSELLQKGFAGYVDRREQLPDPLKHRAVLYSRQQPPEPVATSPKAAPVAVPEPALASRRADQPTHAPAISAKKLLFATIALALWGFVWARYRADPRNRAVRR
jgi:protein tyrosine phosphatase (PTP) superfamily phosphohydrolase (DUF442 family)